MRVDLASAAPTDLARLSSSSAPAAAGATPSVPGTSGKGSTGTPASGDPAAKPADSRELQSAVDSANEAVQKMATNLKFETDQSTGTTVVRVIDSETQKVLRQMPSEEMLSLAKAMDRMRGMMIHLKV